MSEQKQQELESGLQSGFGHSIKITTKLHSEKEQSMDSLKQENQKLKSQNHILRAQNELLRAHASSDTLLLLQQNNNKRDSMSNKRICLRSFKPKKSSFSERICDDLSEVILQFLPIEDKFRFECVSKQFQRTVYRRHYELIITEDMIKNLKILKSILKKLPNIKSLNNLIKPRNKSFMDLIIKNCNQLTELKGSLSGITEKYKQLFAKKFGPQLTSLRITDSSYDSIISSFVNIRDINYFNYFAKTNEFYTKIKSKHLNKVSTDLWIYPNNNNFQTFIDYNKFITHLDIYFLLTNNNPIDPNLKMFSQLIQLISLRLRGNIELKSLKNGLKQLSHNCRKLKELSLEFVEMTEDFKTNDFMSEIKKFKELKRLTITVIINNFDNYFEFYEYFINSLKTGLKYITHLNIDLNDNEMNEIIIENIVNYLPNIQNLIIRNQIQVTERTEDIVSRFSTLVALELNISDNSLIDSFMNIIIKNNKKLKLIEIY